MLMMFAKGLRKISWNKVCPFNENDLFYILNEDVAFSLVNLMDEDNNSFIIKSFMDAPDNSKVFGPIKFDERVKEFAEIMDSRIERLFITKKTDYIFFDAEEQKHLQSVFEGFSLTCQVDIYIKKNGKFEKVTFEEISTSDFKKVRKFFRKANIIYVLRPERYVYLNNNHKAKEDAVKSKIGKAKAARQKAELAETRKVLLKYPGLENVQSHQEFKEFYRKLAKQYHPDIYKDDPNKFVEINDDFDKLQNTHWYKNLGKEESFDAKKPKAKSSVRPRNFIEKIFGV